MVNIKLLDCTLRDGGYLNDWNFGSDELVCIFERIVNSGTDIIEVGFLDERRTFDINRSIMPDSLSADKIYGKVNKKSAMIVGMIDYGTCSIGQLQPCEESYLDGIRVIFKKHLMHEALAFCGKVKNLGYKVFTQAVSITSYNDEELIELIDLVNQLKPYALSMVDTYGLLHKGNLLHYFEMMNDNLLPEIGLGYHSHNNFQLAYANCIEVLKIRTNRTVVVDATLFGMGKSAGNAPIELLAMHLNDNYNKDYCINQLLEAIDGNIMKIHEKTKWGYSFFYYLSASNHCHPNYVGYLMDKHTLSIKSVNEILKKIEDEKKLLYDEVYIKNLYYEYQNLECDDGNDRKRLRECLGGKEILVLGPGISIKKEKAKIHEYIKDNNPTVISINFIPDDFNVDYVFLSNPRRYIRLAKDLKEEINSMVSVIATSNVTRVEGDFDYTLTNEPLLDQNAEIIDNSFIMLLKVLIDKNVRQISCAGLDGYSQTGDNYIDSNMEYWFARREAEKINTYVRNFVIDAKKQCDINFLTTTYYID